MTKLRHARLILALTNRTIRIDVAREALNELTAEYYQVEELDALPAVFSA